MTTNARTDLSIDQLRTEIAGEVIAPDDPGYDDARKTFMPLYDSRRPAVIIKFADAREVGYVVALARESGLELAVRSGGHSGAGHSVSHGGIVLDLSLMKGLEIDPGKKVAWAEAA